MHRLASRILLAAAWLSCCLWFAPKAAAHPLSVSVLSVDVGHARLESLLDLDVPTLLDVQPLDKNDDGELQPAELDAARERLVAYVDSKLKLRNAGAACTPGDAQLELNAKRRLLVKRSYTCPGPAAPHTLSRLVIDNSVFMEDVGGHRVVAKFVLGTTPIHHVFLPTTQRFEFDASRAPTEPGGLAHTPSKQLKPTAPPSTSSHSFVGWLREGVKHILIGFDHILFVIALVVVVRRPRELLLVVTSFTLAHSLTLALGATGLVSIASRLVESLIAASIVYVAVDNYRRLPKHIPEESSDARRPGNSSREQTGEPEPNAEKSSASFGAPHRHYLTFGFGLVHGFGFAGVLAELGLPERGLWKALLGFNLGVELGQLALVLPLYPLVRWLQCDPAHNRLLIQVSSALIGGVGALWLVDRVLNLEWMPF